MALGQAMFRGDRRRRVLNDETRNKQQCEPLPPTDGARYTDAANVENHPQITQFIPRRFRSYAVFLTIGALAIASIELLHVGSTRLAIWLESGPIQAFDMSVGGGLAAWFSSLVLAGVSVVCLVVFGIRRHRVNDYRARYRVWMWLAIGTLLASANCVAALHVPLAKLGVRLTGWSALGGAAWWLLPLCLAGGWIAIRVILDVRESRGALSSVALCLACYLLSGVTSFVQFPALDASLAIVLSSAALMSGHALLLTAVALYARYIVLDVQGLVPHAITDAAEAPAKKSRKQQLTKRKSREPRSETQHNNTEDRGTSSSDRRRKGKRREAEAKADWVDGSQPHDDPYEQDDAHIRKMSKSQRKKLRKQQQRRAA